MTFAELTLARYSCRHYLNKPVEDEKLQAILEAGRLAPSACNNHPSRVVVCNTPEMLEKASKASYRFAEGGSVFGAPLVLLVCAKTDAAWVRKYDGMTACEIDTTIVTDQMMMQATELGLGTCWVCHFDPDIAREEFELPHNIFPVSMLTVGYASDEIGDPQKRAERTIPMEQFLDINA